jgi:hypothetical protein
MEYLQLAGVIFILLFLPLVLVPLIFFGAAVITIALSNEIVQIVLTVLFVIGLFLAILGADSQEEDRRYGLYK